MSESDHEKPKRKGRLWAPVDRGIWAPRPPRGRLRRIRDRFVETVTSLFIASFIVVAPFAFLLSLLLVYSAVGLSLFGPALLVSWALLTVGFVLLLEKTGHARNFEKWSFPLRPARILALLVSFLVIVGAFYLLRTVLAWLH